MILWELMMKISEDYSYSIGDIIFLLECLEESKQLKICENIDEDSELISIYYGADTTKEQAEALLEKVEETYGDCDVQLEYGGQPIYYFLLSVE